MIFAWAFFLKLSLFWLWLWQLKNYHLKRFKAHFERQPLKKGFSSFWRLKTPKPTPKMVLMILGVIIFFVLFSFFIYPLSLRNILMLGGGLIILAPLFISFLVFLFQLPTLLIQYFILERARRKREKFSDLLVIGVTGSYGKSSTKEFLAHILSESFKVLKTPQNINSEIGIAKLILSDLKPEHQIFVAEIGAYERGKIKQVCQVIQPQIGILTGINEQHLATFGSQENIIKSKYELIENLKPQATSLFKKGCLAVFNGKNKYCRYLYQKTNLPKKLSSPDNVFDENFFLSYQKLLPWDKENLALALTVAKELPIAPDDLKKALQEIKPSLKIEEGRGGWKIINSTYSTNPQSVVSHLRFVRSFPGQKLLVMPCLIELGRVAKRVHFKIGQIIGKVCDSAIITTSDYFPEIKKGALCSGMPESSLFLIEKSPLIIKKLKSLTPIEPLSLKNTSSEDRSSKGVILLEGRIPQEVIMAINVRFRKQ